MLPLNAYHSQLAREETKVVELAFGSGRPPTTIAFVERFDEQPSSERRRVTLQLVDVDDGEELAAVGYDFDAHNADPDARVVYFERTSRGGMKAHLLRAVVEGYIRHTDYDQLLGEHFEAFCRADESGDEPQRAGQQPKVNGKAPSIEDYLEQLGRLDIDDVADAWKARAESPEEINRIIRLFIDARSGYGTPVDGATTILEGLGIDLDRQAVIDAADSVSTTRSFPESWRQVVAIKWELERPLIEEILPVVAEAMWDEWSDTPRPHLITRKITAGYEVRYDDGGAKRAWDHWSQAWDHVETWVEARTNEGSLTALLDEALDLAEDSHNWISDMSRLSREMMRQEGAQAVDAQKCLDVLTSMASRLSDDERGLLNDVEVTRYATLCDMGRGEEGRRILETLVEHPTADSSAGLFLTNMIGLWGYELGDEAFELIEEFIDRTIELADPVDSRLLGEVRNKLDDFR